MSISKSIKPVTLSIVSHGHGQMVWNLVKRLSQLDCISQIIVTLNIAELVPQSLPDGVIVIKNSAPMGFGANHNQAFKKCQTEFFGVINPDIELVADPFPELLKTLSDNRISVVGPRVVNINGENEDSLRKFPTPIGLFKRYLLAWGKEDAFIFYDNLIIPEWIAGMFMLFKTRDYQDICGFNTNYFMYCEDAEICTRLWQLGKWVAVNPKARVTHQARRASRSSLHHFYWHTASLIRYAVKYTARLPLISTVILRAEHSIGGDKRY